jgi:hypothetical protein
MKKVVDSRKQDDIPVFRARLAGPADLSLWAL